MQTVTSADGTTIAYDTYGTGPAVILVGGALSFRRHKKMVELAERLAPLGFEVVNYDRRGRGDSGPAGPPVLEREIEDLAALIEALGGRAALWGWSSGGALALRAAMALGAERVPRVSVYEIPFMVMENLERPTPDYGERLDELVAADDRSGAVKHFMRNAIGIPAPFVAMMRLAPMWKDMEAVAHTLPHDWQALGAHTMYGGALDRDEFAAAVMPVQVVHGETSPPALQTGSVALAETLPNARLDVLDRTSHNLSMKRLAPVLAGFLAEESSAAPANRRVAVAARA